MLWKCCTTKPGLVRTTWGETWKMFSPRVLLHLVWASSGPEWWRKGTRPGTSCSTKHWRHFLTRKPDQCGAGPNWTNARLNTLAVFQPETQFLLCPSSLRQLQLTSLFPVRPVLLDWVRLLRVEGTLTCLVMRWSVPLCVVMGSGRDTLKWRSASLSTVGGLEQ